MNINQRLDLMVSYLSKNSEESVCFFDEERLREKLAVLKQKFLFDYPYSKLAYAVKANSNKDILSAMIDEGVSCFDCASVGEIKNMKRLSENCRVLYNNPIKRCCDIRAAYDLGVRHFTVQSYREVEKILENVSNPKGLEITVRVQALNKKAEIDLSEKFGAKKEEVVSILKMLKSVKGVNSGVSINTGSQNGDVVSFGRAIETLSAISMLNGGVRSMNIGGGIPVSYQDEDKYDFEIYLSTISYFFERFCLRELRSSETEVFIELGRSIVAEVVDLVIPVLWVEEREGGECAYINDGLFTSFSDHVIHGWQYKFDVISDGQIVNSDLRCPYLLYGRTCDSGDKIKDVQLPCKLKEGDYLLVQKAGAYMDSQSSYFNGFEPPKYVSYSSMC